MLTHSLAEYTEEKEIMEYPLSRLFMLLLFQNRQFPSLTLQEDSEIIEYNVHEDFLTLALSNGKPIYFPPSYTHDTVTLFWEYCSHVDKINIIEGFIKYLIQWNAKRGDTLTDSEEYRCELMNKSLEDEFPSSIEDHLVNLCINFASEFDTSTDTIEKEIILNNISLYHKIYILGIGYM